LKLVVVVDTNVAVVASQRATVSARCVERCVLELLEITSGRRRIVLDLQGQILLEYLQNLSLRGQPGVGDAFVKWVHDNQGNPEHCVKDSITAIVDAPEDFEEFPRVPGLAAFDRSDRKFVAVARAHRPGAPILQATDTKWWGWAEVLRREGVEVIFLCEEELRERFERKFARPDKRKRG
jgi:hypothetical protein